MSTNFYLSDGTHVGKRSAAGAYCTDCKRTLCKDGQAGIHTGRSEWHTACPDCGKQNQGYACSFTWAIPPYALVGVSKTVRDEYGREYSPREFGQLVRAAAFHFYDSVGREFS